MPRSYRPSHRGRRKRGAPAIALVAVAAVVVIGGAAAAVTLTGGSPKNASLASSPSSPSATAAAGPTVTTAAGVRVPASSLVSPATASNPAHPSAAATGSASTAGAPPATAHPSPSGSATPRDTGSAGTPTEGTPTEGTPTESAPAGVAPSQNQGTLEIAGSLSVTDTLGDTVNLGTTASGGAGAYTWTVTGLPSGVTASSGGYDQAAIGITGAAAEAGTYPFTVTVSDSGHPRQTLTESYTLTVLQPSSEQWSVEPLNLTQATVGTPYSGSLSATNGVTVTWAVSAGSLPPGLSLDPGSGTISGTPDKQGGFNFSIVATDVATGASKQGGTYNFVVYPASG
jgi:large repetitive protein